MVDPWLDERLLNQLADRRLAPRPLCPSAHTVENLAVVCRDHITEAVVSYERSFKALQNFLTLSITEFTKILHEYDCTTTRLEFLDAPRSTPVNISPT